MCAAKASRHLVLSNARFSLLDIAIVTIGRVEDECLHFIPLTASYDCFIPDEAIFYQLSPTSSFNRLHSTVVVCLAGI